MNILVTGAAGFIGFHCCRELLKLNHCVIGIDSINDYYDINLKLDRLRELGIDASKANSNPYTELKGNCNFTFIRADISEDMFFLDRLFKKFNFDCVINLAAQAGVRYSIECPECYVRSNIVGFFNILECCRKHNVSRVIYASSSSVYGNTDKVPFSEDANVNSPESLYAATKVCNELFANVYNKIYGLSLVGLRFFTVYGPWGRPDMAPFIFTDAIVKDKSIRVFGNGELYRDFTYIDDIVNGIISVVNTDFYGKSEVLNIGHGSSIKLLDFINIVERELNKEANKVFCGMQKGDVYTTYADTTKLESFSGYKPSVDLVEGIHKFVEWYKGYYKV